MSGMSSPVSSLSSRSVSPSSSRPDTPEAIEMEDLSPNSKKILHEWVKVEIMGRVVQEAMSKAEFSQWVKVEIIQKIVESAIQTGDSHHPDEQLQRFNLFYIENNDMPPSGAAVNFVEKAPFNASVPQPRRNALDDLALLKQPTKKTSSLAFLDLQSKSVNTKGLEELQLLAFREKVEAPLNAPIPQPRRNALDDLALLKQPTKTTSSLAFLDPESRSVNTKGLEELQLLALRGKVEAPLQPEAPKGNPPPPPAPARTTWQKICDWFAKAWADFAKWIRLVFHA